MKIFVAALTLLLLLPATTGAAEQPDDVGQALSGEPGWRASARPTKDISPYGRFQFTYTQKEPGKATGFKYRVRLVQPPGDTQPPTVRELELVFAKGTRIDLEAVPTCDVDDATITAQGAQACPLAGRIATGVADVYVGTESPLGLSAQVFASKAGVTAILSDAQGNVIRVLRGSVEKNKLTVPVPSVALGGGKETALVRFELDIGSNRSPVFTTPKTCPKGGWPVVYAPLFEREGRVKLTDVTKCRAR